MVAKGLGFEQSMNHGFFGPIRGVRGKGLEFC